MSGDDGVSSQSPLKMDWPPEQSVSDADVADARETRAEQEKMAMIEQFLDLCERIIAANETEVVAELPHGFIVNVEAGGRELPGGRWQAEYNTVFIRHPKWVFID